MEAGTCTSNLVLKMLYRKDCAYASAYREMKTVDVDT